MHPLNIPSDSSSGCHVDVRSLACVDLMGALAGETEAQVDLHLSFFVEDEAVADMHIGFRADRARALSALHERCRAIECEAGNASSFVGVPRIEAELCVDGERVLVEGFPELAARRIAPLIQELVRAMRPPVG